MNDSPSTTAQTDVLYDLAWAMYHFGSLTTGGSVPKRKVDRLIECGLARCIGPVEPCDGDGRLIEGRVMRAGYQLTRAGLTVLLDSDLLDRHDGWMPEIERHLADHEPAEVRDGQEA